MMHLLSYGLVKVVHFYLESRVEITGVFVMGVLIKFLQALA
jgi:hypothetical protein